MLVAALLVTAVAATVVPERPASAQEVFTATVAATAPTTIDVGWTNPPPTALGVLVRFRPVPYDAARAAEVPSDPQPASSLTWNEAVPGTTYDVEAAAVLPDGTEVPAAAVVRVVTPVGTGPEPTPVTGASVMDLFSDAVWIEWPETGLPGERVYLRVDTVPPTPRAAMPGGPCAAPAARRPAPASRCRDSTRTPPTPRGSGPSPWTGPSAIPSSRRGCP